MAKHLALTLKEADATADAGVCLMTIHTYPLQYLA
ncbi:hypothetical protein ACVWW6_000013 [Bradyrhizobium sp. USDA 3311]